MQPEAPPSPSPSALSWAAIVRLGVVASLVAAMLAVIVYALTPIPAAVIVAVLGAAAFFVSWHASTRAA